MFEKLIDPDKNKLYLICCKLIIFVWYKYFKCWEVVSPKWRNLYITLRNGMLLKTPVLSFCFGMLQSRLFILVKLSNWAADKSHVCMFIFCLFLWEAFGFLLFTHHMIHEEKTRGVQKKKHMEPNYFQSHNFFFHPMGSNDQFLLTFFILSSYNRGTPSFQVCEQTL